MQEINNILNKKQKFNLSLTKEYDKALTNEIFKNLVSKINLDKTILMKYTSRLEESSIEYNNCLNCKSILECKNKIKGYALLPTVSNSQLNFNYKACKFEKKHIKETNYKKNIFSFDMPNNVVNASLNEIYKKDATRIDSIKWLLKFLEEYQVNPNIKGLYLHGSFGSGKSYLITAVFNELAKKGIKSAIIFWPEYLSNLKSSFNSDFKERNYFKEKLEYIKKVPLLLIDDIGAENLTQWSRDEIFCPIVQYRMDKGLPTFFTSNLNLEQLENHFTHTQYANEQVKAKRIIERIKQISDQMELVSKNLRK